MPPSNQQAVPRFQALAPINLANASPKQQKDLIGEQLYPAVSSEQPELAGKITGMLLKLDNSELLYLLQNPEALKTNIQDALNTLGVS
jgi:polyadenylate-binding protein